METFDEAFARLNILIQEYPKDKPKRTLGPTSVQLRSIKRLPQLFSVRSSGRSKDNGGSQEHADALVRTLKAKPQGERWLDPVVVFEVAGVDYCVDGHHRIVAYKRAKVQGKVPVTRIGGSLADAIAASVKLNSKVILPLTREQRHEAAWKLVKIGHGTKELQAQLSGMGQTFIAELRRLKRGLTVTHPEVDWGSLWEAKRLEQGEKDRPEWTEEMGQAEIEEYAHRLLKTFGRKLHTRTTAVVCALASIITPQCVVESLAPYDIEYGPHLWEDEDETVVDF